MITALFNKRKTLDGVRKLKKISDSTILVLQEAEKQGIVWEKIKYTDLFKLTFQGESAYFHAQIPSKTTEFAYYCCNNKRLSKNILSQTGLSVSRGFLIKQDDEPEYWLQLFEELTKPLVLKPADSLQGKNVYLNITSATELIRAGKEIYAYYGRKKVDLLVEQMFDGDEYRILASREKILSVIQRLPANVTGDGVTKISDLIESKNKNPLRQKVATYKSIIIDGELVSYLADQQLQLDSILPAKKCIFLRQHSALDIGLGGDTIDVTDQIHPSVSEIVRDVMDSIPGLALTGIDFMTKNIQVQQKSQDYVIIEINASPSLDWNEFPLQGPQRQIAFEFLKIMFPNLK